MMRVALFFALALGASAVKVTPVEQVIKLIGGLKSEVEKEGAAEAKTYGKFSCFCRDNTRRKSDSVKKLNKKIGLLAADISKKTNDAKDDSTELGDRNRNQEQLSKDLDNHNAQCKEERATYDARNADLSKAISSLRLAIKAMKTTGGSAASLLEVQRTLQSVQRTSAVQEALLKVDPSKPGYGYHSQDIIDLCDSLLTEFKGEKSEVDTEWGKTDKACVSTRKSIKGEMTTNQKAMTALEKRIKRLEKEIAKHREDLVTSDGDLKDDELYLNDLKARCEERANDFDQRSSMRNDELGALTTALEIITNDVKGRADQVNERALLIQTAPVVQSAPAFLQNTIEKQHSKSFLKRADSELTLEAKRNSALSLLASEGRRLGSLTISAAVARMAADPFKKVKGLIQGLIERLLTESEGEATKKGFCDEALGSAKLERNNRFEQADDLSRDIAGLEAKEDELTQEIAQLTKDLKTEKKDLEDAQDLRKQEKEDNAEAIKVAQEGLDAVSGALQSLKTFYDSAARATVLIQASPLDEDSVRNSNAAAGAYNGKQGGMKAVFGLLETIQSDFDRTIRQTEKAESNSHDNFQELSQAAHASIAGKETKKELDIQDLKSARVTMERKTEEMQDTVDLMDTALKELERLKPTCIDTGMSYAERVKKREEEIKALENAHTILQ